VNNPKSYLNFEDEKLQYTFPLYCSASPGVKLLVQTICSTIKSENKLSNAGPH